MSEGHSLADGCDVTAKDDPELLAFLHRLLTFEADGSARVDSDVGLVLADWLEERNDPRAADVRYLAAFRPPKVNFPAAEEVPEDPDEDEPRRPPQPIWRWPPANDPAPPWWDLLAELRADGSVYVRWHADPYSDVGRRILRHTSRYFGSVDCPREQIPQGLDRCLAELIAAVLGWSRHELQRQQQQG